MSTLFDHTDPELLASLYHAAEIATVDATVSIDGKQVPEPLRKLAARYLLAKAEHPHAIILIQRGDFFETISDSAMRLVGMTGVGLTMRDGIALAGVPFARASLYQKHLAERGYEVVLVMYGD